MLQKLFNRLGYRMALRRVRDRSVSKMRDQLAKRRLLVVLPQAKELVKPAMIFIQQIDLPPSQVTLVWTAEGEPDLPEPYEGSVLAAGSRKTNWLNLPGQELLDQVTNVSPDVAIDLTLDFCLPYACLISQSSATVRVGLYNEKGKPFYDILFSHQVDDILVYSALRQMLSEMEPAFLPVKSLSKQAAY